MLMMSRREGETILIGDAIEIVITHIGRTRVRVGIRAPRETPVIAREVKLVRRSESQVVIAGLAQRQVVALADPSRQTKKKSEAGASASQAIRK